MSMGEKQAEMLARAVGGEAWQSGGGVWVVTRHKGDGSLVVFSSDAVCEYADEEAFDAGRAKGTILLDSDEPDEGMEYVIVDDEGNVFYRDDELELGWTDEFEAEREARAWESRGEGEFFVRRKTQ